ncbi:MULTISPECIES: hypothetical protein [Prevotella]|uniref:Contig61, whole genome shotgun sequence n=1 Tax=Prevotella pectinovora TaxID=1602169 RepID=A0A0D0HC63_9BACT|nr:MULTISPECIES: hypothetical protein [Prevotella]KIP61948.1 hypothetical protein ST44_08500 [Prevotella pectinovora]
MKEIDAEIYLNWDNNGATVKFSDEEADKLLALWKEAQDTILKDMEEEDYWEKFDPWLQEKAPDLYEKIMKAFHEEFWERMGCYSSNRDDYDFVSVSCDIDGVYLDDNNKIVINQIFPPSE